MRILSALIPAAASACLLSACLPTDPAESQAAAPAKPKVVQSAATAKPDLTVSIATCDDQGNCGAYLAYGANYFAETKVCNQGKAATTRDFRVFLQYTDAFGDQIGDSQYTGPLAAGACVELGWDPQEVLGYQSVWALVDTQNDVAESNEGNNTATAYVYGM